MSVTAYNPIYTTAESVKVRLNGKVAFQTGNEASHREMSNELLGQMIVDAETAVEQDLRGRYAIPFRSKTTNTWEQLPDHSKRAIRTIVDQKAVILILMDSFGSGSHINADGYLKNATENYELLLRRLLGQDMEGAEFGEKRFRRTPPLDDVKLAATNVNDSGAIFAPVDAGARPDRLTAAEYAASQTNDPSLSNSFFSGGRRGPR